MLVSAAYIDTSDNAEFEVIVCSENFDCLVLKINAAKIHNILDLNFWWLKPVDNIITIV